MAGRGLNSRINAARAEQWQRKAVDRVTLDLPFPVSVNRLHRRGRDSVHRSPAYQAWLTHAGHVLNAQKPGRVVGPYDITLELGRPDNRRRDAENHIKGVSDLLVAHGVVEDDSLARNTAIGWAEELSGCRVSVVSVGAAA